MSVITVQDCRRVIENNEYDTSKSFHFQISPLSESSGFLGSHYKLKIYLNITDDGKKKYTINAFVKALPESKQHQKYVEDMNAFKKEFENFDKLFPMLQEISGRFNHFWAPQCYLTSDCAIVFKDMSSEGFRMMETAKFMDLEHIKVAAEILGYFHSASVIFESINLKNNINICYPKCVEENVYVHDTKNVRYHWFECGIFTIMKMVEALNKYSENEIKIIRTKIMSIKEKVKDQFKTSCTKRNVVCHGDLWVNNFMFRYSNGKPVDCRLVDFQLTRYAPAALDVASMLHLCLDGKVRNIYKAEVIQVYEKAFASQIREAGLDVPETNITKDVEEFRLAAIFETLLYEMITQLDTQGVAETVNNTHEFFYGDRSKFVMAAFKRDPHFRKRLSETLEELLHDFIL